MAAALLPLVRFLGPGGGLRLVFALLFLAAPALAQKGGIDQAGVCSRCHVSSSLEWGISKHSRIGTNCQSCHGQSLGHVANEQDAVKPDRRPRGAAIAQLCLSCHNAGCPKTKETAGCQSCHQVHALVDPRLQVSGEQQAKALDAKRDLYLKHLSDADTMAKAGHWAAAQDAYQAALKEDPASWRANAAFKLASHRSMGAIPGFAAEKMDERSGLPQALTLYGTDIRLVLIEGGEFDMGSDARPDTRPVHTISVEPFYLAPRQVTQSQWIAFMGSNPSANKATDSPVEMISWHEARAFIAALNKRASKGAFRLPTEAEWEYASGSPLLNKMTDAVSEWCSSLYRPYPYYSGDGREDLLAAGLRVVRGGNFSEPAEWWQRAARHSARPEQKLESTGLRLAFSF